MAEELRPTETMDTPEAAVVRLGELHATATAALRAALARYLDEGVEPDLETRLRFRYPELRVTYAPHGAAAAPQPRHRQVPGAGRLRHHGHPARHLCALPAGPADPAGARLRRHA